MMVEEGSVELLYALHYFINESTDGDWRRNGEWVNKMGRESIEKPDAQALKNIFALRAEPDVTWYR